MRISDWSSDVCSSDLALGYFVSIPVLGDFNQTRIGYGGFASATYSLSDEFRLTAGGRVSLERLTAAGQGAAGPFTFRKSQTTVDWKIGAEYDVAHRIMVYGNIQTGYKIGTASGTANVCKQYRSRWSQKQYIKILKNELMNKCVQ